MVELERYSLGHVQAELRKRLSYGVPLWRIQYLIKARRIEPQGRYGVRRMFNGEAIDALEKEIRAIDANKPSCVA